MILLWWHLRNFWREWLLPVGCLMLFCVSMGYIVFCLSVVGQR